MNKGTEKANLTFSVPFKIKEKQVLSHSKMKKVIKISNQPTIEPM